MFRRGEDFRDCPDFFVARWSASMEEVLLSEASLIGIDLDEDLTIGFYNSESDMGIDKEDNVADMGKLTKAWDKMTKAVDKVEVKGKTEDGRKYSIYCHYDTSGIGYWLSDDAFSFRFTCNFNDVKPDGLSDKDLKAIEKGFSKVIDKVDSVLRKSMKSLDAQLKDGGLMEIMESTDDTSETIVEGAKEDVLATIVTSKNAKKFTTYLSKKAKTGYGPAKDLLKDLKSKKYTFKKIFKCRIKQRCKKSICQIRR